MVESFFTLQMMQSNNDLLDDSDSDFNKSEDKRKICLNYDKKFHCYGFCENCGFFEKK